MSKKRLLLAFTIPVVTLLVTCPASAAWFLKLDGVEGESHDTRHPGWIEIHSFSLGNVSQASLGPGQDAALKAKQASSGAGAGKVTFNPFSITRKVDKASPVFFQNAISGEGKRVPRAVLEGTKPDGQVYFRVVLTDCLVSSYRPAGGAAGGPTEQIALTYTRISVEDLEPKPTPTPGVAKHQPPAARK